MAAEKTLRKVEEHLKCSICLDTYTDPRLLQCQHVYCHDCLRKLCRAGSITCPTCRQVTPIRARRGVADLQSALHIKNLLDIMEEHKQESSLKLEEGVCIPVSIQYCSVHAGKELELYCETCLELICLKCAVKSGKHYGHDYDELDEAFEKCKKDITSSMKSIEEKLVEASESLTSLDRHCDDISGQEAAVESDIDHTAMHLHKLIDIRKAELVGKLRELAQSKKDEVKAQKDQVEVTYADLSSYLDFIKETLATKSDMEMLTMKMAIVMQVQELPTPNHGTLKLAAETDLKFYASSEVNSACEKFGEIIAEQRVKSKKSYRKGLSPAHSGSTQARMKINPLAAAVAKEGENLSPLVSCYLPSENKVTEGCKFSVSEDQVCEKPTMQLRTEVEQTTRVDWMPRPIDEVEVGVPDEMMYQQGTECANRELDVPKAEGEIGNALAMGVEGEMEISKVAETQEAQYELRRKPKEIVGEVSYTRRKPEEAMGTEICAAKLPHIRRVMDTESSTVKVPYIRRELEETMDCAAESTTDIMDTESSTEATGEPKEIMDTRSCAAESSTYIRRDMDTECSTVEVPYTTGKPKDIMDTQSCAAESSTVKVQCTMEEMMDTAELPYIGRAMDADMPPDKLGAKPVRVDVLYAKKRNKVITEPQQTLKAECASRCKYPSSRSKYQHAYQPRY